jgi:hypothetical protein
MISLQTISLQQCYDVDDNETSSSNTDWQASNILVFIILLELDTIDGCSKKTAFSKWGPIHLPSMAMLVLPGVTAHTAPKIVIVHIKLHTVEQI